MRSKTKEHIVTEIDPRTGALFARNPYNTDFPGRIVFMDVNMEVGSFTGDRTEFLGRNGSMASPAALLRERLSNKVGAAMDPCLALQIKIDLADGEESEIVFTLGTGRNIDDVRSLIERFRGSGPAQVRVGGGVELLESHSWRSECRDPGQESRCAHQWLAPLPDDSLPHLGTQRILPVERSLRFPRSVAGFYGADLRRATYHA